MKLRYKGNGSYIHGVPARDLDDADIEAVGRIYDLSHDEAVNTLTASGIYAKVGGRPKEPTAAKPQETEGQESLQDIEATGE